MSNNSVEIWARNICSAAGHGVRVSIENPCTKNHFNSPMKCLSVDSSYQDMVSESRARVTLQIGESTPFTEILKYPKDHIVIYQELEK